MKPAVMLCLAPLVCALLSGCAEETVEPLPLIAEKDYSAPLPPGQVALRRITDPARIPDFSHAFAMRAGLTEAVDRSLNYLSKPSSQDHFPYGPGGAITHQRVVRSLGAFRETLAAAGSGAELNALLRQRFEVWESVGCDGQGSVLFTGYYCPIFDARLAPDERFRYPLHRVPDDLVKDSEGRCLGRRRPDGSIEPGYPDRRKLLSGRLLSGSELCYLRDPFEAYIVTVQGSAKLRLADGSFHEIGYAANNGHSYLSVGRLLVEDGKIPADELSLARMIRFFREYPNEVRFYTSRNPRYVFFKEARGGPYGSLNERVTPYRTIATDKEVYPRACLAFIQTRLPAHEGGRIVQHAYHGFALDQDTGGAIRAAGRCDLFLGTGDEVGELAGRTLSEGRLYYLFAKP